MFLAVVWLILVVRCEEKPAQLPHRAGITGGDPVTVVLPSLLEVARVLHEHSECGERRPMADIRSLSIELASLVQLAALVEDLSQVEPGDRIFQVGGLPKQTFG